MTTPVSRSYRLAGTLAAAFLASGCLTGAQHEVTPSRPVVKSFTASPATVAPGGSSVLSWNVTGATTVVIAPDPGPITGSTATVTPAVTTTYVLTATNAGGSSSASVTVTVGVGPPTNLAYAVNPATYTVGTAIAPNGPTSTGGAVASYSVSPALPAGLTLSTTTGVVSGTPTTAAAQATYTVTATNAAGSTTVGLVITVTSSLLPPTNLAYAVNPATYYVGVAVTPNAPTSGGGAVASYTVSPPLPDGLSLNRTSGVITGMPTAAVPQATYTVTATNASGSTTAALVLAVGTISGPPAGLRYATNPVSYPVGAAIPANVPSSTGGTITSYAVSPTLPAGLAISATTGVISGTPNTPTAQGIYVVTGTNPQGATTANVTITVTVAPAPPTSLAYSANPVTYAVGLAITPNRPSSAGGAITNYTVSPALPAGLLLDTATGIVSGTPTAATASAIYTVTGTNAAGNTTVGLSITVSASVIPPSALAYSDPFATYGVGAAIFPNFPTSSGGAITAYAVQPPLPAGLVLDAVTGIVTGTPTATSTVSSYVVTGSNAAGSTSATLSIAVVAAPTISTQPVSASVVPPSTAAFTVVASGVGVLTYQWQRNGTNVAGATSATYVTPPTAGSDTGSVYLVVVRDDFGGTVTSNPATLTTQGFSATGSMAVARTNHTATLLGNGTILVAGGVDGATTLASAEIYDPATGTFSATGSMNLARQQHAAVLLSDGKVLVVGGFAVNAATTATAEIYDPATGTFANTGSMSTARQNFAAVALPGGTVLVAGGEQRAIGSQILTSLSSAEIFTPGATAILGAFAATGPMSVRRAGPLSIGLVDGTVLVCGGFDSGVTGTPGLGTLATAEIFTPGATPILGAFARTSGNMNFATRDGSITTLSGAPGLVLVAGGQQQEFNTSVPYADIYDPATKVFTATGSMLAGRAFLTASRLPDGRVLVAGGRSSTGILSSAEIYTPGATPGLGAFAAATNQGFAVPRYDQTATVFQVTVGQTVVPHILVTGGSSGGASSLSSAEIWTNLP